MNLSCAAMVTENIAKLCRLISQRALNWENWANVCLVAFSDGWFSISDFPVIAEAAVKCSESTNPAPVSDTDKKTQSPAGLEHWVYPGKNVTLQCPQAKQGDKVHWLVLNDGTWEVIYPNNLAKFRFNGTHPYLNIHNEKLQFFPLNKNWTCRSPDPRTNMIKDDGIHTKECLRIITRYMCIVEDEKSALTASSSIIVRPTMSEYWLCLYHSIVLITSGKIDC